MNRSVTGWGAILLLIMSCSGAMPQILAKSPGAVLKAFMEAASQGRYSEAETYVSSEALATIKGPLGQMGGGFKGMCDGVTKKGKLKSVEIVKEETRGEGATVTAHFSFTDGSTKQNDVTEFIKEEGVWKITLGGN